MEIAAGGELYDYLSERKKLEEKEARRIFRQIATAVFYCHKVSEICFSSPRSCIWVLDNSWIQNIDTVVILPKTDFILTLNKSYNNSF